MKDQARVSSRSLDRCSDTAVEVIHGEATSLMICHCGAAIMLLV
jgi:hypothetical protein